MPARVGNLKGFWHAAVPVFSSSCFFSLRTGSHSYLFRLYCPHCLFDPTCLLCSAVPMFSGLYMFYTAPPYRTGKSTKRPTHRTQTLHVPRRLPPAHHSPPVVLFLFSDFSHLFRLFFIFPESRVEVDSPQRGGLCCGFL